MNNLEIAVIVQGPTNTISEIDGSNINCYKEQKKYWSEYKENIIYSTWEDEINIFDVTDKIIFNSYPKLTGQLNLW
jgi:hypothetical protein